MNRRDFVAGTAALLVSPRRSWAQGKPRRVGFLGLGNWGEPTLQKAWLEGLRNHGWIDGRSLIIEYRLAPSQDRLPAFAAELVALSPDPLIASTLPAALALKSVTASIPIIFVGASYPERFGPIGLPKSLGVKPTGYNMERLAARASPSVIARERLLRPISSSHVRSQRFLAG